MIKREISIGEQARQGVVVQQARITLEVEAARFTLALGSFRVENVASVNTALAVAYVFCTARLHYYRECVVGLNHQFVTVSITSDGATAQAAVTFEVPEEEEDASLRITVRVDDVFDVGSAKQHARAALVGGLDAEIAALRESLMPSLALLSGQPDVLARAPAIVRRTHAHVSSHGMPPGW